MIGESPDRLTLAERERYRGWTAAFEYYTPQTLPLRVIEALGPRMSDCIQQLAQRLLDPQRYQFIKLD